MAYIRMGGQKKHGFCMYFFSFNFLFKFVCSLVAVVSKIDFRFNCVSMQCFIFDFFSFTYHIRFISSKKTQKTFVWSVLHRWWKRLCDSTIKPTKKQDVLYTYFSTVTYFFRAYLIIVCRVKLLYHDSQAQGTFWANSLSLFAL